MIDLIERLREMRPDFISESAAIMHEAADALEQAQEQIDALQSKVHLCAGYDKMESTLKSIQKLSGDWYQGYGESRVGVVMKRIWYRCNEVFGPTTNEIPVSTDVGSSDVEDRQ